ncbi:hypothetical protein ACH4A7_36965 [Streptomyces cyaneofuscatus]|uniref:hypothetical protein n=1 Tax=Streptomyces cyaneofuscatus TaxID=66883 RepID=UPI0037910585
MPTKSPRPTSWPRSGILDVACFAASLAVGVVAADAALATVISPARFGDLRPMAAVALFLLVALVAEGVLRRTLLEILSAAPVTAPARQSALSAPRMPPSTSKDALAEIAAAAAKNSAIRAAARAFLIDESGYLRLPYRWRGYPAGDATFYLAPGAVLHFRPGLDGTDRPTYTVHTSTSAGSTTVHSVSCIYTCLQELAPTLDAPDPAQKAETGAESPSPASSPEAAI